MRQHPNVVEESALAESLHDPEMTKAEKRAIFASWISDARAVPDAPAWRQIDGGKILLLDQILEALKLLDDAESPELAFKPKQPSPSSLNRRRRSSRRHQKFTRWFWRNDDDPPPTPTAAAELSFA
jgi:hypothetical protein